MKLSRFQGIYNGMNSLAKKVYDAVPIENAWSMHKIVRELQRMKTPMEVSQVQGCLKYMLSMGIIKKDGEGDYIRTELKIANNNEPDEYVNEEPPTKELIQMATEPNKAPSTENDVFNLLASLAQRAQDISDQADHLKEDIEKAALTVQTEFDKNSAELGKLRQLKALLAGLGT